MKGMRDVPRVIKAETHARPISDSLYFPLATSAATADSGRVHRVWRHSDIRPDGRRQRVWVAAALRGNVVSFLVGGSSFHVESRDSVGARPLAGAQGW